MNANGRRLDAWLIYKCGSCDRTWNLPLIERAAVTSVTDADLQAIHRSDPVWVRDREHDVAMLGRHCDRIKVSSDLTVRKSFKGDWSHDWSALELTIQAQRPTGLRLDRLLAGELKLGRAELLSMQQKGGLQFASGSGRTLRKPVSGSLIVQFLASGLTESQRAVVLSSAFD